MDNDKSIESSYSLAINGRFKGVNGILLRSSEHYDAIIPILNPQPVTLNPIPVALPTKCGSPPEAAKDQVRRPLGPDTNKNKYPKKKCKPPTGKEIERTEEKPIKIVGLNVNGFLNKFERGILDIYLSNFEIICISESHLTNLPSNFSKSLLGEFSFFSKPKPVTRPNGASYGGFHGLTIFAHPKFEANLTKGTISEAVLWLDLKCNDWEITLGCYYFPCVTSKYYDRTVFDDVAADIISIRQASDRPIYMLGDANAHCGQLSDILQLDSTFAVDFGLDLLMDQEDQNVFGPIVTKERANADTSETNANGKDLTKLCQASDIYILNGRAGQDKEFGNHTCFEHNPDGTSTGISTIDLCLASSNGLKFVQDFYVDTFDAMLSDRHTPICLTLNPPRKTSKTGRPPPVSLVQTQETPHTPGSEEAQTPPPKFDKWSPEIAEAFNSSLEQLNLDKLYSSLESAATQTDFDSICEEFSKITFEAALKVGACKPPAKSRPRTKKNARKQGTEYKPWFDPSCNKEKTKYFQAKNASKRNGNRVVSNKLSKDFKKFLDKKRGNFTREINKKLKNLKSKSPREYWNIINGSAEGKKTEAKVTLETFLEHFKELSITKPENEHTVTNDHDAPHTDPNPLLNKAITAEELIAVASDLKSGKANGPDGLRNEFLKQLPTELYNFLCALFNKILDTGIIPKDWAIGIIMPLFKNKGSATDPSNYRGITLLSCLGKLFTAILNKRIASYMKLNNLLGMEQAGFRASHSTQDHVFVLHHVIDFYRQQGKQVYCAFVDYSKAFDLVNRSALWCKLFDHGIKGKILTIIRNMYSEAKSCVRAGGSLSSFFRCTAGVRQGENLSPILFAIYLNDFKEYLVQKSSGGLTTLENELEELNIFVKLYTLLYADDTVILAETAADLQSSLNALHSYCKQWDLTVNLDKTKIIIFSKGRKKAPRTFTYGGEEVKVVDDYTYLGVVFNYNGNFKKAIRHQKTVANRALNSLAVKARALNLDTDTQLELFQR